jgi:hypothetical protein
LSENEGEHTIFASKRIESSVRFSKRSSYTCVYNSTILDGQM